MDRDTLPFYSPPCFSRDYNSLPLDRGPQLYIALLVLALRRTRLLEPAPVPPETVSACLTESNNQAEDEGTTGLQPVLDA